MQRNQKQRHEQRQTIEIQDFADVIFDAKNIIQFTKHIIVKTNNNNNKKYI
jgi:hypothetical protein